MIASLSFSTLVMMRERSWDCWCSWGDSWGEKEEKVVVSGILSRGEGRKVDAYHFVSPRRRRDDVDICCRGGGSGGSVKVKSNVWHVFGDGETRWWGTLAHILHNP